MSDTQPAIKREPVFPVYDEYMRVSDDAEINAIATITEVLRRHLLPETPHPVDDSYYEPARRVIEYVARRLPPRG